MVVALDPIKRFGVRFFLPIIMVFCLFPSNLSADDQLPTEGAARDQLTFSMDVFYPVIPYGFLTNKAGGIRLIKNLSYADIFAEGIVISLPSRFFVYGGGGVFLHLYQTSKNFGNLKLSGQWSHYERIDSSDDPGVADTVEIRTAPIFGVGYGHYVYFMKNDLTKAVFMEMMFRYSFMDDIVYKAIEVFSFSLGLSFSI